MSDFASGSTSSPWLHIVLHEPEIPPNTGNIGRTCVALGAKLWLVRPLGFRLDAPTLRRAGMDYWEHLQWEAVDNWDQLTQRLPDHRYWFATKFATQYYSAVAYERNDVLVFGSESRGLPASLREQHAASCIKIPMESVARSLNLACSVSIIAYEAHRQLIHHPH